MHVVSTINFLLSVVLAMLTNFNMFILIQFMAFFFFWLLNYLEVYLFPSVRRFFFWYLYLSVTISTFTLLWSENSLHMISIPLNFLKFVLCPMNSLFSYIFHGHLKTIFCFLGGIWCKYLLVPIDRWWCSVLLILTDFVFSCSFSYWGKQGYFYNVIILSSKWRRVS